jgi:hypothetical protein
MSTIMNKFPIPMSMGLCLPKECTLDDLQEFKPFLLKVVNGVLPEEFEHVRHFNETKLNITSEDLLFVSPILENEKITKFNGTTFLICVILSLFIVTVVIATVMLWKKDKALMRSKKLDLEREQPTGS